MSDMITNHAAIDVFIGIDVGKHNHHAVALDRDGEQVLSKALPQNETKLKALLTRLAKHGTLLVVVDQPATIGALPVAVAQAEGHHGRLPARVGDAPHRRPAPR
jgi:predicted NBD/HSP70 family sugar kinase